MKLGSIFKSKLFIGIASTAAVAAAAVTAAVILSQPDAYRIIKVLEFSGSASVDRNETGTLEPFEGMNLQSGDTVSVYDDSEMYLNMDEDKYLTIEENTVIDLIADGTAENSRTEINLREGAILNNITQPLSAESSYSVNTPKAVMAVRGTKFRVEVTVDEEGNYITTVTVENGKVEIRLIDEDGNLTNEYIMAAAGDTVVIKTTPNSSSDPAIDGTSFFVIYDAESGKYIPLYSVDGEKHEQPAETTEATTAVETTITVETTTETTTTSTPVTTAPAATSYAEPVTTVPTQQTTAAQTSVSSVPKTEETTEVSSTTTEAITTADTTTSTANTTTVDETEASIATTEATTPSRTYFTPVVTGTPATTASTIVTTTVTTVSATTTATATPVITTVPETTTVITTVPETTTENTTTSEATTTVSETSEITTTTTVPETTTTTTTTEVPVVSYSVVFEVDGTVYDEFELEEGEAITSIPDVPEKEGYTGKWVTSDSNELTVGTVIEGDMTITAEYTINTYTITFFNENGTVATETVDYGSTVIALPDVPALEGHTGKWVDSEGNEFTDDTIIRSDMTITAEYTINTYTVTFADDNGTVATETVDYGSTVIALPDVPALEGHTGKWVDSEGNEFTDDTIIRSDMTITAEYTAESYTVTFVDRNGATIAEYTDVAYGEAVEAPASGYEESYLDESSDLLMIFLEWNTDFTNITGSATISPVYIESTVASELTLILSSGTISGSTIYDGNCSAELPAPEEPSGELSTGWFKVTSGYSYGSLLYGEEPSGTVNIDYIYTDSSPTETADLYAGQQSVYISRSYAVITYTYTNPTDDLATATEYDTAIVFENENITEYYFDTSIFDSSGYTITFDGWLYYDDDGNEYTAEEIEDSPPVCNLTAVAQFTVT